MWPNIERKKSNVTYLINGGQRDRDMVDRWTDRQIDKETNQKNYKKVKKEEEKDLIKMDMLISMKTET